MILIIKTLSGALVFLMCIIQASWSEDHRIKARLFKVVLIVFALISVVLGAYSDFENYKESETAKATLEGVSSTIFPKDIDFVFKGVFASEVEKNVGVINISIYVIPKDSPFFGKWGVTMTCNEFGMGKFYSLKNNPSKEDIDDLFGAQGVDFYQFQFALPTKGATSFQLEDGPPLRIGSEFRTLDKFLDCQFLCLISSSEKIRHVSEATMRLKGNPVPFNLVFSESRNGFLGVTLFRPAFERSRILRDLYPSKE